MAEIGESLREARMRARIDVSEIEAKTKIRAKYLRALENEEWGLLPGPTFVKSFLRTYADALGLDGKSLVEEYRLHNEAPADAGLEPVVSSSRRSRARGGGGRPGAGPSRAYMALVGAILVIIILLIVALVGSGSGKHAASHSATHKSTHRKSAGARRTGTSTSTATPALVSLSLRPQATVYVCLIGDGGRKLIPGVELQPGAATSTYHARRFEITLGNNSVTMVIDGTPRSVPSSSEAIGYSITKAGGRHLLRPGQLPTCA
jgi:cytoskeleton protein RodZ